MKNKSATNKTFPYCSFCIVFPFDSFPHQSISIPSLFLGFNVASDFHVSQLTLKMDELGGIKKYKYLSSSFMIICSLFSLHFSLSYGI
jgi:hypothetical protein